MTKITFYKRGETYYGFKETGHAGFDDEGHDVVCAAISAMTMLIVNTVEVVYAENVEYTIDEDSTDVQVMVPDILDKTRCEEKKRFAISGLFNGYFIQLMDMLEDYYDYLSIEEVEK